MLAGSLLILAVARRRWWPVGAAVVVAAGGLAFASVFHDIAPRTHWYASDLPVPGGAGEGEGPAAAVERPEGHRQHRRAVDAEPLGEPQSRRFAPSRTTRRATASATPGTTAQRFDVKLEAGESNYTELGAEAGLAGALAFIAWSLALLVALLGKAWTGDRAAAAIAAAFAAVLALGIQTDAIGVPWLAYCLFWLTGSALTRRRDQWRQ